MASYPSYFQRKGTGEEWLDDVVVDSAVEGTTRVRALSSGKKKQFTVVHLLNTSELSSLETFYDTNRAIPVSFTFMPRNATYSCVFVKAPKPDWPDGGTLATVTVVLRQQ